MSIPKEIRILLAVIVVGAAGFAAIVRFTDVCRLRAVTLNGLPVTSFDQNLGLNPHTTIFQQPLDSVADVLLAQNGIRKVDIAYTLPNALRITTNSLTPVCMLLDETTGLLYCLDATGRVLPLDNTLQDWERPVLTGTRVRRLYEFCSDMRVGMVVPQLENLRAEHGDVYKLIHEVNFDDPGFLTVTIAGLPCAIRVAPNRFEDRMDDFIHFMQQYDSEPYTAAAFDLRYDNVIVRVAQDEKKKKDSSKVADTSRTFPPVAITKPDPPAKPSVEVPAAPHSAVAAISKPTSPTRPSVTAHSADDSKPKAPVVAKPSADIGVQAAVAKTPMVLAPKAKPAGVKNTSAKTDAHPPMVLAPKKTSGQPSASSTSKDAAKPKSGDKPKVTTPVAKKTSGAVQPDHGDKSKASTAAVKKSAPVQSSSKTAVKTKSKSGSTKKPTKTPTKPKKGTAHGG